MGEEAGDRRGTAPAPRTLVAGRYRLERQVARGGTAEVHEGRDIVLDRPVTVKILRQDRRQVPAAVAGFESEARRTAQLSGSATVAVFDGGVHDGRPYLVLERLPGFTVADLVADVAAGRSCLDRGWIRAMAEQVLAGLAEAHGLGLVHGDVKPANILLTPTGGAKLADFGSAEATGERPTRPEGIAWATPAYLAPERRRGSPATPAGDLYAVGVVLHEALVGRRPDGDASPTLVGEGIDPGLAALVARALAPDPAQRYGSARDMAAALEPTTAEVTTSLGALADPPRPATATEPTVAIGLGAPAPRLGAGSEGDGPGSGDEEPTRSVPISGRARLARADRRAVVAAAAVLAVIFLAGATLAGGGDDSPGPGGPTTTVLAAEAGPGTSITGPAPTAAPATAAPLVAEATHGHAPPGPASDGGPGGEKPEGKKTKKGKG